MKKIYLILGAIILLTLSLQLINIHSGLDGFHNWKSTHYLVVAEHFTEDGIAKHGLFVPRCYWTVENNYTGIAQDNLPVYPMIVAGFFNLFGHSLEVARSVEITFHILNILLMFLIVKTITKKQNLALLTSFFYALFPISIYFSQNIQNLSTGMFFVLVSVFSIYKWYQTDKYKYFAISIVFAVIGILSYYTFAVVIPLMIGLLFPLKDFWRKSIDTFFKKPVLYIGGLIVGILSLVSWQLHINNLLIMHDIQMGEIYFFNPEWWLKQMVFLKDNLGYVGMILFLLGIYFYQRENKLKTKHYLTIVLIIAFSVVMSRKTWFHQYHWYPLLPFVAVMTAYCAWFIIKQTKQNKKIPTALGICFVFMISTLFVVIPTYDFKPAPGNSIAGEYIHEHYTNGSLMYSGAWSGQSFGVLWHSHIEGIRLPGNISELKTLEKRLNTKWIFIYIDYVNDDVFEYVRSNYNLVLEGKNYEWLLYQKT